MCEHDGQQHTFPLRDDKECESVKSKINRYKLKRKG